MEIAKLAVLNYTLLDVNILASTQFNDLKLQRVIFIVIFYFCAKFQAYLRYNKKMWLDGLKQKELNAGQISACVEQCYK